LQVSALSFMMPLWSEVTLFRRKLCSYPAVGYYSEAWTWGDITRTRAVETLLARCTREARKCARSVATLSALSRLFIYLETNKTYGETVCNVKLTCFSSVTSVRNIFCSEKCLASCARGEHRNAGTFRCRMFVIIVRFYVPDLSVSKKKVRLLSMKFHETLIYRFSSCYMWTEMVKRIGCCTTRYIAWRKADKYHLTTRGQWKHGLTNRRATNTRRCWVNCFDASTGDYVTKLIKTSGKIIIWHASTVFAVSAIPRILRSRTRM
jgi:hypothetical protein